LIATLINTLIATLVNTLIATLQTMVFIKIPSWEGLGVGGFNSPPQERPRIPFRWKLEIPLGDSED
jgi:hypothetical protein